MRLAGCDPASGLKGGFSRIDKGTSNALRRTGPACQFRRGTFFAASSVILGRAGMHPPKPADPRCRPESVRDQRAAQAMHGEPAHLSRWTFPGSGIGSTLFRFLKGMSGCRDFRRQNGIEHRVQLVLTRLSWVDAVAATGGVVRGRICSGGDPGGVAMVVEVWSRSRRKNVDMYGLAGHLL